MVFVFGLLTIAFMSYDLWSGKVKNNAYFIVPLVLLCALGLSTATTIEMNINHIVKDIEVKACLKDKGKP
jgi:hypothetical protein